MRSLPVMALGLAFSAALAAAPVRAQDSNPDRDGATPHPEHQADDDGAAMAPDSNSWTTGPRQALQHAMGALRPSGPRLGIMASDTPDGVLVNEVQDDTLAASAGLQAGDIVYRIGEVRIDEVSDVAAALRRFEGGGEVNIHVIREGEGLVELSGTLPERPRVDGNRGGFLGVHLAKHEGSDSDAAGVTVEHVVDGSAAWYAGLEQDDVILSIDGQAVAEPEDVAGAVAAAAPGTFVKIEYSRDDVTDIVRARLGKQRPAARILGMGDPGPGPGGLRLLPGRARGLSFGRNGGGMQAAPGVLRMQLDGLDGLHDLDELHEHLERFGGPGGAFGIQLPSDDFGAWIQKLESDGHDLSNMSIRIEDGVMTIDRNGEIETYQLDELDDLDTDADADDGDNSFEWSTRPVNAPRRRGPSEPSEQV